MIEKQMVNKEEKALGNESGRGMVETLGVLAIMGVLAIGGIAGYRWAMDKYNANEILNEVRKRAITASQQRILGRTIDLSEYGNNTIQGHSVTALGNYGGDTSFFTLTVAGIEKSVCDKVLAEIIPFSIDTWVGEDSDDCSEGNNDITFAFANTLDGEAEPETVCEQNEYLLPDGTCRADKRCPDPNEFWNGRECVACPTSGSVELDSSDVEDSCEKCSNAQLFMTSSVSGHGYCVYCPTPRVVCDSKCCADGEVCDFYNRTCVSATCQQDSDCSESTPLCNTVTGQCFAGCKTNDNCNDGEFCDLDMSTVRYISTQKPGQGTCQSASGTAVGSMGWIKSTNSLYWWSAENFCKAKNKTLIDLSNKCSNWSEIKANGYGDCKALAGIESTYATFWTKHSGASHGAFNVDISSGNVYRAHHSYDYKALCE